MQRYIAAKIIDNEITIYRSVDTTNWLLFMLLIKG